MAQKKNNTILWIGAAVLVWYLWKKRKAAPGESGLSDVEKQAIRSNIQQDLNSINIAPLPDREQNFAQQYKDDIQNCKY